MQDRCWWTHIIKYPLPASFSALGQAFCYRLHFDDHAWKNHSDFKAHCEQFSQHTRSTVKVIKRASALWHDSTWSHMACWHDMVGCCRHTKHQSVKYRLWATKASLLLLKSGSYVRWWRPNNTIVGPHVITTPLQHTIAHNTIPYYTQYQTK